MCKASHVFLTNIEVLKKRKDLEYKHFFSSNSIKFPHKIGLSDQQYNLRIKRNLDKLTSHSAKMAVRCWHFGRIVNIAYHVITGSVFFPLSRKVQILEINENANFTCSTSKNVYKEKIFIWYEIWR